MTLKRTDECADDTSSSYNLPVGPFQNVKRVPENAQRNCALQPLAGSALVVR